MFGHVQLTFFLFFFVTPKVTRSIQFNSRWAELRLTNENSGSLGSHKQQCSKEDGKCSYSSQCCQKLVCLQAGYSDGHCIKKSHLQPCSKSSDCPDDCVCEVMGLKVDGVTGFCVARLNLEDIKQQQQDGGGGGGRRLRTGLRSGVGGLKDAERSDGVAGDGGRRSKTGTMENIYDEMDGDAWKTNELQGMIDRLEAVKDQGRRKIGGNRRSKGYLPPRSVSYLSIRNTQQQQPKLHQQEFPDPPSLIDVESMTSQERYALFCKWLRMVGADKGLEVRPTRDGIKLGEDFAEDIYGDILMSRETRLGHRCHVSDDCKSSNSFVRWQVCCAKVNIMRQGVRLVCERITPITRCVD